MLLRDREFSSAIKTQAPAPAVTDGPWAASHTSSNSGSSSNSAQRKPASNPGSRDGGKRDFSKKGTCAAGAGCPKHPFYSWVFGKAQSGEVVALSAKRDPFCPNNHSREADGELTEEQLSKKKMIAKAKKMICLDKAAQVSTHSNYHVEDQDKGEAGDEVNFVNVDANYLTSDSDDDHESDGVEEANACVEDIDTDEAEEEDMSSEADESDEEDEPEETNTGE